MKFSSTVLLATAALGSATISASAQTVASPAALLQYVLAFLSPTCKSTIESVLAANATFGTCLNVQGLVPILNNTNSSIIPQVDAYLTTLCGMPACSNATIQNVTMSVAGACSTELSYFGINNSTLSTIMNAYPTAREVACLSTSNKNLTSYNSTMSMTNSTNSTNSTLCPTTLLYSIQSFLGMPLTNSYIDSLLLGGNSTAYNQVLSLVSNSTVLKKFACTDCVVAGVDVVLENYPKLANTTFMLPANNVTNSTNATSFTLESLFLGVCNVTVGPNVTLPMSIKESAFNTTLPFNMSSSAGKNMTARSIIAKGRFKRWE